MRKNELESKIPLVRLEKNAEKLDAAMRERPKLYSAVELVRENYHALAAGIDLHGLDRAAEILRSEGLKIEKSTLRKYMQKKPSESEAGDDADLSEDELEMLTNPDDG